MAKHILERWQGYTVRDCDCRFCLYSGGKRQGEIQCLAEKCVCKDELREALRRERSTDGSKNQ